MYKLGLTKLNRRIESLTFVGSFDIIHSSVSFKATWIIYNDKKNKRIGYKFSESVQ